jgi:hypothetical protein
MSTILDALAKARRERADGVHDGPSILDAPQVHLARRRNRLRILAVAMLTVLASATVIALCLFAYIYIYERVQTGGSPLLARLGGAHSTPAPGAPQDLPPPSPREYLAADLPTPVPISEILPPSRHASVPPPPVAVGTGVPATSSQQEGFTLGAVLYDPENRMAVVNGITVREGGVYDDFRVLKITQSTVTVQRTGEQPVVLRARGR